VYVSVSVETAEPSEKSCTWVVDRPGHAEVCFCGAQRSIDDGDGVSRGRRAFACGVCLQRFGTRIPDWDR